MCLNGPRSESALEESFGCDANVGEETAVQLPAAATFSRGTPRAEEGGGVHLRPDARQRAEHSPQCPQAVAEVRGRGKEGERGTKGPVVGDTHELLPQLLKDKGQSSNF